MKLLIPTLLSFALASGATTCPKNWLPDTDLTGDTKCCYGWMTIDGKDAFCCIYNDASEADPSTSTVAADTTTDDYGSWSTAEACNVKVPFTATDYSAQVSSASKALQSGATTTAKSVASNEATVTSGASTASSASASVSGTSASTSNGAGPIATAHEAVLGGAAVLAGLLVL